MQEMGKVAHQALGKAQDIVEAENLAMSQEKNLQRGRVTPR